MKKDLHPQYYSVAVKCETCKNEFTLKSTKKEFKIDVCSKCHPVYTGNRSQAKSTGMIEKFNRRLAKKDQQK
ncbi:50S ribosomal protein L31 [Mycoplasmopsis synoviae]|uniref:Large ribosomal subunit protein bL31 n=2 Tax=Mycoplasmopsis synoviae TaxID=2109 RepID=RL31_MYCS5|nr:50S ribosomal protein L31 [Mycoplasmopsis synoviae]Q4A5T5.1 RecName: Full=Large ribosomal subunit protein bL31; AltName: Full=50S ribosomal protein L31 [Mycoplasmopsis synoviae 53]AAZ43886.1 50S ribosomal protein L31 [Mycoplasmopsis synoviae 53]AKB11209.1 50S ribosomal protein L31 [Mycoplasmopsis synoviae ATCC 25204]AKJ20698.1 LSU ribosomal protein L31p, zinc-dependent [Mycoplasmopsis synoviae]AQU48021.1 LSU ribosomal protein L31p, zinc-dependent [Mycoplasmopsis synoviae]AWL84258.1 50S rib